MDLLYFCITFSCALPLPFHVVCSCSTFCWPRISMRSLGSEFSPLTLHETWRDLHHEFCIALLCRSWIKWYVLFRLVQVHKSYAHRWNSHLDAAHQTRCVIGRYPMRWRLRTFAKEFRGKQQAVSVSDMRSHSECSKSEVLHSKQRKIKKQGPSPKSKPYLPQQTLAKHSKTTWCVV